MSLFNWNNKEEFSIPDNNISFAKMLEKLHDMSHQAFKTFQFRYAQSLNLKQIKQQEKYLAQRKEELMKS